MEDCRLRRNSFETGLIKYNCLEKQKPHGVIFTHEKYTNWLFQILLLMNPECHDSRALLISILGFNDATMMQEVEQLISATHNIGKVSQWEEL